MLLVTIFFLYCFEDEFGYPMKELTLYSKKQKLEAKLKSLEAVIAEKHKKVNSMSRDNKLKRK